MKALGESKKSIRFEKKMGRLYEFLLTKGGKVSENELEMIEAFKQGSSDKKLDVLDDKFDKLVKLREDKFKDIDSFRNTIEELKRNNELEKEKHKEVVDLMQKNFEKMQANMKKDYDERLTQMQNAISNTLQDKLKLEYIDEHMKKLYNNVDTLKQSQSDAKNDLKYKEMEDKLYQLQHKIDEEKREKDKFEKELKALKLEFSNSNTQLLTKSTQDEKALKDLMGQMNKIKNNYEEMFNKYKTIENKSDEQKMIAESYKEIVNSLKEENARLQAKYDEGSTNVNQMKDEISKIQENYQERVLKLQERMQQIETVSTKKEEKQLKTNCDLLESDDMSYVKSSNNMNSSYNQLRDSQPNLRESKEDTKLNNMYNDFNVSNSETSWDLSKTNIDDNTVKQSKDKLDTIREELSNRDNNDELTKPRFGDHYVEIQEREVNEIEEEDELSNTIIEC